MTGFPLTRMKNFPCKLLYLSGPHLHHAYGDEMPLPMPDELREHFDEPNASMKTRKFAQGTVKQPPTQSTALVPAGATNSMQMMQTMMAGMMLCTQ